MTANAALEVEGLRKKRMESERLELLDVEDATVVANDTAGGLLLLSLATGHPALGEWGASC